MVLLPAWRWYIHVLNKRPLMTQCISTGVLAGFGDIIAQRIISPINDDTTEVKRHDWIRTTKMCSFGILYTAPALYRWYRTLDRYIQISNPRKSAIGKMFMDQVFFAPIFLSGFFVGLGLLENHTFDEIKDKFKNDYANVLMANYKLWPAVQILNFYFVPLQHRVVLVNSVSVLWNSYLSWKFHSMNHHTQHDNSNDLLAVPVVDGECSDGFH